MGYVKLKFIDANGKTKTQWVEGVVTSKRGDSFILTAFRVDKFGERPTVEEVIILKEADILEMKFAEMDNHYGELVLSSEKYPEGRFD